MRPGGRKCGRQRLAVRHLVLSSRTPTHVRRTQYYTTVRVQDVDGAPPADAADWEEWDLRRSLFDNHVAPTFEKNLEHMYRHYGFHFPDPQCLKDPEGLLRYLGAKLRYGRVALYTAGDDEGAKRFRSLHAVQRHMVDSGRCQMCYDGNEDEYDDFYEYPCAPFLRLRV